MDAQQNKIMSLLVAVFVSSVLSAQDSLTLQEAWNLALDNRASGKVDKINIAIANEQITQSYEVLYPGVSANIDVRDNLKLPTTIVPNVFNSNAPEENIAVQFGTQYNTVANVQFQYPILDWTISDRISLAKLNYDLANIRQKVNDLSLKQEVVTAYFAVLINAERLTQLDANTSNAKEQVTIATAKVANGLLEEIQLRQLQVNHENLLDEKQKMEQQYDLSRQVLNLKMGLEVDNAFTLDHTILKDTPVESPAMDYQIDQLPQYKLSEKQTQISSANRDIIRKSVIPTVSIYGFAGVQGQGNKLKMADNEVFNWTDYYYIGAKLSWPINNFFTYGSRMQESKLQIERSEQQLTEISRQADERILEAYATEKNNRVQLHIARRNLDFSKDKLQFVNNQFSSDLVTTDRVSEAQNDLSQAQTEYLVALYNYLTSKENRKLLTGQD